MFPFSHFMPSFLLYATGGSGEKPPKKKWPRIVALVIVLAVALAFCLLLIFEKDPYDGKNYAAKFTDMSRSEDTLTFSAAYSYRDNSAQAIEIARDIIVATDSAFTNVLQQKYRSPQVGQYLYGFDVKGFEDVETLYLKPPILFTPTKIPSVAVPLAVGKAAKIGSQTWFTVEAAEIEAAEAGSYTVKVTLDTQMNYLPRLPKLVSGDTICGGSATPYFDANDNLDSIEILFTLSADSEDAAAAFVEAGSLKISNALTQVATDDIFVTSSVKSLSVVTE